MPTTTKGCRWLDVEVVTGQVDFDPQGGKRGLIEQLLALLTEAGMVSSDPADVERIILALLRREELGSTGLGRGVAVPHTRCAGVPKPMVAVAVCVEGAEFAALDGEKIQVFVLILCPLEQSGNFMRLLEAVSRELRDEVFARLLRKCKTGQELLTALTERAAEDE